MRLYVAVGLLLAVVSCAAPPPTTRPKTDLQVPAAWTAEHDASAVTEVTERWWVDFGDARLAAVIDRALEHNTELRAAAARVQAAAATARIAGADLKPQLGASFLAARRKQNFVGFPIPGRESSVLTTRSTSVGVSLDLSWEIDLWGRLSAQAREGLVNLQASRADLAGVKLSVAGQTAKAWFAAAEARQQVLLAEQTVASFESSAEQVRGRFEHGVRPALDLRLALAQLASAQARLQARHQQLDAASRQLEVLIGRYPGRDLEFPEDLIDTPAAIPAGLPADLVARRPDLAAAERRLVALDQRYAGARASLYPRLSLTGSGGTQSNQLSDLVKGDFSVWNLVGNLTAPLFQAGRLRAGVDLARAEIDASFAVYVGTALHAYAEVESTLAAEHWLAAQVGYLAEAARHSLAAQQQAEVRYRAGLNDYITVLESQRRTFESESAQLTGRRQRLDNRVDLYLSLGGGFEAQSIVASVSDNPAATSSQESSR